MNFLRSRWIWRLILPVLLAGAILTWVGARQALDAMSRVPLDSLVFVLLGFLVVHVGCALKWRMTLQGFGATLNRRSAIRAHGAGLAANLWLPSVVGGDLVRTAMALRDGSRSEALILGSLIDRVADLVALLTLGVIGLLMRGESHVGSGSATTSSVMILGGSVVASLVIGFWGAVRWRWTSLLPKRMQRPGLRLRVALRRVAIWRLVAALVISCGLQLSLLLMNRSLAIQMGTPADLSAWLVAWPLAKACAMLPLGLGGLGIREAAFASIATPLGFPRDLAVSQSLLWQAILMTGGLIAGAVCGFTPQTQKGKPA